MAQSGRNLVRQNRARRHRSRGIDLGCRPFPQTDEVHPRLCQIGDAIQLEVH